MFAGQFNHLNTAQAQFRAAGGLSADPRRSDAADRRRLVYIIDSTNGRLGAMAYDDSSRTLQTMPPIDLNRVYAVAAQNQRADLNKSETDEVYHGSKTDCNLCSDGFGGRVDDRQFCDSPRESGRGRQQPRLPGGDGPILQRR